MIKWFKSSDAAGIGMWVAYFVAAVCLLYAAQALAGGMEQNMIAQKTIEITVQTPENDWEDYLIWLVPGVIVPIVLFWLNKRRK